MLEAPLLSTLMRSPLCTRRHESHLDGVGWWVQEAGIEVEEGGLRQAALVQAALVGAVQREAQQVCASAHSLQVAGPHPVGTPETGFKALAKAHLEHAGCCSGA